MQLKFVDLFSGAGGMSCGFARNGAFRPIGAADLEVAKPSYGIGATNCNETYARNIGLKPLSIDLSQAVPRDIADHFGFSANDVDVLISCAPCTGFSQKQSRNHAKSDSRNLLVERTAIFVEAWQPTYLIMENVKELIKGKHSHHFHNLRAELNRLGYEVEADVHDLSTFGLPQRRLRALLVAKRGGRVSLRLPQSGSVRTVRDAIGHLPRLTAGDTDPVDPMHTAPKMTGTSLARAQAIPRDGGSWIDMRPEDHHLRIPSMDPTNPGSFPDVYGRLAWDRPAPTVTRECSHPGNGRYTHPEQDRLLSVREMALVQGYPEDYQFCGPMASRYRQIGDAVPPMISAMIADAIIADWSGHALPAEHQPGVQFKMAV
jgi:DNA (cytosine-5)-methyltransferase 1